MDNSKDKNINFIKGFYGQKMWFGILADSFIVKETIYSLHSLPRILHRIQEFIKERTPTPYATSFISCSTCIFCSRHRTTWVSYNMPCTQLSSRFAPVVLLFLFPIISAQSSSFTFCYLFTICYLPLIALVFYLRPLLFSFFLLQV